MMLNHKKQIVVGLSGGVDSSVAALLLKREGHEVIGVYMQNWEADKEDPFCSAQRDLTDARTVCDKIGIPLKTINFAKEYWDKVFQYFLDELSAGRTPNPDVFCNQEIKFNAFLDYALSLGADYIATGHYSILNKNGNLIYLQKSLDENKDQSYFLHRLNQHQLNHSIFPVGHYKKALVRKFAEEAGLITSTKKDSTGICFIGERKFKDFLKEYLLTKPGNIESVAGEVLGQHQGLMFYTLGQRQGLGLGGKKEFQEAPWYVLYKDITRNVLIVGQDQNHPLLFKASLECDQVNWITKAPQFPLQCKAKIRYRQADQPCHVTLADHNKYLVEFTENQRAITPGQAVVFYDGDTCLGGGIIL